MGNAVQGNAPSLITLDLLRVALRWVHLTAAVIWIGGTFFYLFVIRPSVDTAERAAGWKKISQEVEGRFHEIVQLCIWTFFISGAILTYDRLTSVNPGLDYIAALVIKVLLVLWMVYVSGGLRRSGSRKPIGSSAPECARRTGHSAEAAITCCADCYCRQRSVVARRRTEDYCRERAAYALKLRTQ